VPEDLLLEHGTVVRYLTDLRDELADVRTLESRRHTMPGTRAAEPGDTVNARRQVALLNDIAKALVEAIGLDDGLARILKTATESLGAERSTFLLMNESGRMVTHVHQPQDGPPLASEALMTAAARSRAGILSLDAQQDLRFSASASVISQGIRSCICSPVWADNRILGMLLFDRGPGDPFMAEDLELAALVGYQAAIAVDRTRFLDRARSVERRRSELLRHFSPDLATTMSERESLDRDPLDLAPRRDVTALHVVMDGTASLPSAAEPEHIGGFLCVCLDALARIVWEHGGVVEWKTCAGLTALFGVMDALQKASGRALSCALAMQKAFAEVRGSLPHGAELTLRIGAETGPVLAGICGPTEKPEFVAIGQAVDTAVRLAAIATPGAIAVGPLARAAAGAGFGFEPIQTTAPSDGPAVGYKLVGADQHSLDSFIPPSQRES
jgi:class 3 adenylate cyclase